MKINIPGAKAGSGKNSKTAMHETVPAEPLNKETPVAENSDSDITLVDVSALRTQFDEVKENLDRGGEDLFLAEKAILQLSAVCDGASSLDSVGFNGTHANFGNAMARQLQSGKRLTPKQLQPFYDSILHVYSKTQLQNIDFAALRYERDKALELAAQKIIPSREATQKETEQFLLWASDDANKLELRDRGFIGSLSKQFRDRGNLSDNQWKWAQKIAGNYLGQFEPEIDDGQSGRKEKTEQENRSIQQQVPGEQASENTSGADERKEAPSAGIRIKIASRQNEGLSNVQSGESAPQKRDPIRVNIAGTKLSTETKAETSTVASVSTVPETKPGLRINIPAALQKAELNATQLPQQALQSIQTIQKLRDSAQDEGAYGDIPILKFMRAGQEMEIQPDPSQWRAIKGLSDEQYGALTGAAGTGKTTVTRALVMQIEGGLPGINIANYAKIVKEEDLEKEWDEERGAWVPVAIQPRVVPALCFAAYTGKAMQQMKKALPAHYHDRCFTIHSLLGYHPIFVEDEFIDPATGKVGYKTKRKFVPYFTEHNKMPWRIIILDEASMIPIFLWEQLRLAMREDCRVIMIGDINQLPPVHGRSVFGFAMLDWPSFELTQIHRQKGEDNPIVENAWRILRGDIPQNVPGHFDMIEVSRMKSEAFGKLLLLTKAMHQQKLFDPEDHDHTQGDMIIVSQNKDTLGQDEINQRLLAYFNPPSKDGDYSEDETGRRVMVIAGFEKKLLAVGDKMMVTQNDHEVGITNGMTGKIVRIIRNGNFSGQIGKAMISPDQLNDLLSADLNKMLKEEEKKADKEDESLAKRAASHIVTLDFGAKENGERHTVDFSTAGEVNSLMHAYAATCHKCQGSEFPTIIVVCHSSNHRMLYREWLYTAVTRAAKRVVLLYDQRGLHMALTRQRIKGKNLKEKAQSFIDLTNEAKNGTDVDAGKVATIPQVRKIVKKEN